MAFQWANLFCNSPRTMTMKTSVHRPAGVILHLYCHVLLQWTTSAWCHHSSLEEQWTTVDLQHTKRIVVSHLAGCSCWGLLQEHDAQVKERTENVNWQHMEKQTALGDYSILFFEQILFSTFPLIAGVVFQCTVISLKSILIRFNTPSNRSHRGQSL